MSKKDIAHYVHYVFYTKFGRSTRVEEDRTDDLLREHVLKGNMNIVRAFPRWTGQAKKQNQSAQCRNWAECR